MSEMTEFDIKKGFYSNIEGARLGELMKAMFGNVAEKDGTYVSHYGVMSEICVQVVSKTQMLVRTVNVEDIKSLSDEEILDSKRKLNSFLEEATGFTAKQRMDRAKKKAKEGKL